MTITGFDPPEVVTIGRDCQFTLRAQEGLIELTIDGSVDTESCSASGTYGFQYGSCCSSNGSWYAGRI
jgi:hypothetical protein